MNDVSQLPIGARVVVRGSQPQWPTAHAVYLGPLGRGLFAIAEASGPAFYRDPQHDVDPRAAEFPNLRRATWTPRRVRPATILATVEDHSAYIAACRYADQLERQAERDRAELAEQSTRRIASALDMIHPQASAYAYRGEIRLYGDGLAELAALVCAALDPIGRDLSAELTALELR